MEQISQDPHRVLLTLVQAGRTTPRERSRRPWREVACAVDEGMGACRDFIAHALQDLPVLLAKVRRLRAAQPAPNNDDGRTDAT
jgi:hypothetical protein